ncbi:MAG: glycoside hydrolase family 9 protein [Ignavibacteriales bacterium]|nr:glycoside hydrolase family 9 protein [Ignavibacteriales bacterium]
MKKIIFLLLPFCTLVAQPVIRISQIGFLPGDIKTAVVLSETDLNGVQFQVLEQAMGKPEYQAKLQRSKRAYGQLPFAYVADFSKLKKEGNYVIQIGGTESVQFPITKKAFRYYLGYPSFYLLEQRCGYNPIFDTTCHQLDGIAVGGPDNGKFVDNVGGYHDASDYLRFLITTSYTVGIQLLAYRDYPALWVDTLNSLGQPRSNDIPDILDEAKWGLDWMLKMNPEQGKLYHQSADDRDHSFWDLPFRDNTDYGWGKGKNRPVYFATGVPQGLDKYFNSSTGVANIAGRSAAVFALASSIWRNQLKDAHFADLLLKKAVELYGLGKEKPGTSESVPGKAPYRFHEVTYYDDLEWAAVELYKSTKQKLYLNEAIKYSILAADSSWMGKDTAKHYEYFPYVNPGHYELFPHVNNNVKAVLKNFYRQGLLKAQKKAEQNAFRYGVPFIWVSNNLATGLITQAIWYKKMSGSNEFDGLLFAARDWLLGRNPWGQSFIIGIPERGSHPTDPHSVVTKELGIRLTGALVDGPVYGSIFNNLKGLRLTKDDRFAKFQSSAVVYHDDIGDYSTNEPTIDGTASLLYIFAYFSQ